MCSTFQTCILIIGKQKKERRKKEEEEITVQKDNGMPYCIGWP